jgi:putative tricarboxylic transport membrane protein
VDVLQHLLNGFAAAASVTNLMMAFLGALLGTLVGVLPGLGPTAAIAFLFPVTTVLPPVPAIIMLGGIYYGTMYGGSTTAILLNIPGEVASVPPPVSTAIPSHSRARVGPRWGWRQLARSLPGRWVLLRSRALRRSWRPRRCASGRRNILA